MLLSESGLLPDKALWNELEKAKTLHLEMCRLGLPAYVSLKIDVEFVGSSFNELSKLRDHLTSSFQYEMKPPRRRWFTHRMEGLTSSILVDEESIMVWIAEMVKYAHNFKCRLGDWGAFFDLKNIHSFETGTCSASDWFKQGVAAFEASRMTEAFGFFRAATLEDPEFADGFASMGTVQLDLWLLRAALENYEKAVQVAPEDVTIRLNRGAARDYLGDREGAIADYDYIIDRRPDYANAFLNRGNTKYAANDIEGACADWRRAKDLGSNMAQSYLQRFCNESDSN